MQVISVNILYFDLGQGKDYIYHDCTHFTGLHQQDTLQLSEDQQAMYRKDAIYQLYPEYYLIKGNNFDDVARDTLDEWVYFLKHGEIKDNFQAQGIRKAGQELNILKLPEPDRIAYERYCDERWAKPQYGDRPESDQGGYTGPIHDCHNDQINGRTSETTERKKQPE